MLPPIKTTLTQSSAVTNIVSRRIYRHGEAPQDTTWPYITWQLVSGVPENNLSDLPPIDRQSVQVDCWHQTDRGVEELAIAARNALEPSAHMTAINTNLREPETKLYRIGMQFDWWLHR